MTILTTVNDADLQPAVAATYLALADVLAELSDASWDMPSLCEGWRVREVVAHVTMPARLTPAQFGAEMAESGGDFAKLSERVARRDATLPRQSLLSDLRGEALHTWAPPVGGHAGALNHAVIHGLDITTALDRPRSCADPVMGRVLDDLTAGGMHAHFDVDLDGLRLTADDLPWSYGSGSPISSTAADLALLVCGRGRHVAHRVRGEVPTALRG